MRKNDRNVPIAKSQKDIVKSRVASHVSVGLLSTGNSSKNVDHKSGSMLSETPVLIRAVAPRPNTQRKKKLAAA